MLKLKNLLIIGITILISSCGPNTIDYDDDKYAIDESGELFLYEGNPYSGKVVKYFDTEKTLFNAEVNIKDGIYHGLFLDYFKNGQ